MSTSSMYHTEKVVIYCLYGSQTGNSEQAAIDFGQLLPQVLTDDYFVQNKLPPMKAAAVTITTKCMSLDDFLEFDPLPPFSFRQHLILFVSSYGVGQAPLGAYRFRSLAEAILENKSQYSQLYSGLSYAICGLGDSTYTTYLKNPTIIDDALSAAGATQLIPLYKADAHQIGEKSQENVIEQFCQDLWLPLAISISSCFCGNDDENFHAEATERMQTQTLKLLQEFDPDFRPSSIYIGGSVSSTNTRMMWAAILVALVAIGYATANPQGFLFLYKS